jgi:hypothetical protein
MFVGSLEQVRWTQRLTKNLTNCLGNCVMVAPVDLAKCALQPASVSQHTTRRAVEASSLVTCYFDLVWHSVRSMLNSVLAARTFSA